jgi:hypothetical protein
MYRGEQDAERFFENRKVLIEDLLLEVLGAGRHEDPAAAEIAGMRYASVLPVPVPASARSTPPSAKTADAASAISS